MNRTYLCALMIASFCVISYADNPKSALMEEFIQKDKLPSSVLHIEYDLQTNLHKPSNGVLHNMYPPNINKEDLKKWLDAQERERSQTVKYDMYVGNDKLVAIQSTEPGEIHPTKHQITNAIDFENDVLTFKTSIPSQSNQEQTSISHQLASYDTTGVELIKNIFVHSLTPNELLGLNMVEGRMQGLQFDKVESVDEQNSKRIIYSDPKSGFSLAAIKSNEKLNRLEWCAYYYTHGQVRELTYSSYKQVDGFYYPEDIQVKTYNSTTIDDRNQESLVSTINVKITSVQVLPSMPETISEELMATE